jgi:hypothetical protein
LTEVFVLVATKGWRAKRIKEVETAMLEETGRNE